MPILSVVPAADPATALKELLQNIALVCGTFSQALDVVKLFDTVQIKEAADALREKSVGPDSMLEGGPLLERECFQSFTSTILESAANGRRALLVYGPRGVGKTTLIRASLQGVPGVLSMEYEGDGADFTQRFEAEVSRLIATYLEPTGGNVKPGDRFKAIAGAFQAKYKRRPIIIVEVNSAMTPEGLRKILLSIKSIGFDAKLATFIVAISASRSALGIDIGFSQLRVNGYAVPDFSGVEALDYLTPRLPVSPDLPENVINQIGTRAVDLAAICEDCSRVKSESECESRVEKYRNVCIHTSRYTLMRFLAVSSINKKFNKKSSVVFFRLLVKNAELNLADAATAFGFNDPKALLQALAESHAFAVDPFSGAVSMSSFSMGIAIEMYLRKTEVEGSITGKAKRFLRRIWSAPTEDVGGSEG